MTFNNLFSRRVGVSSPSKTMDMTSKVFEGGYFYRCGITLQEDTLFRAYRAGKHCLMADGGHIWQVEALTDCF